MSPPSASPDAIKERMAPLIESYRDRLPVTDATPVVSLGEGSTPLLRAPRASERLGVEVLLKCEGANPTGSFKDRGMTVAISKALEEGAHAVICASTGNTAASAAAYAARAGLAAVVLQPAGPSRSASSRRHAQSAHVCSRYAEASTQALAAARELAERGTHVLVNSVNPYRVEGQKTAAFEIVEELGGPPDVLALPYGGGGNTVRLRARLRRGRRRHAAGSSPPRRSSARRRFASAIRIARARPCGGGRRGGSRHRAARS